MKRLTCDNVQRMIVGALDEGPVPETHGGWEPQPEFATARWLREKLAGVKPGSQGRGRSPFSRLRNRLISIILVQKTRNRTSVVQDKRDRHLAECPECRAFLEETAEVLQAVRRSTGDDPGDAFWAHYHASLDTQLRAREPVSRGRWTWANAALAGGFALILLAVGMWTLEFREDAPLLNGTRLAAMQEIDRLFGLGSEDWFLEEPRLLLLVAGYDRAGGSYESDVSTWINPALDSELDADETGALLQ